ncbi:MAG: hypothetical protein LBJ08_02205, partial [Bifidobacteriaceae bacterium]|nr:hypothetical protein [Bifidobacteriaceae bacterium]
GSPTAVIPDTVTEDQLRQLLQVCPSFDPDLERANEEVIRQAVEDGLGGLVPAGYRAQPLIGVSDPPDDADPSVFEHIWKLTEILREAEMDYHAVS